MNLYETVFNELQGRMATLQSLADGALDLNDRALAQLSTVTAQAETLAEALAQEYSINTNLREQVSILESLYTDAQVTLRDLLSGDDDVSANAALSAQAHIRTLEPLATAVEPHSQADGHADTEIYSGEDTFEGALTRFAEAVNSEEEEAAKDELSDLLGVDVFIVRV